MKITVSTFAINQDGNATSVEIREGENQSVASLCEEAKNSFPSAMWKDWDECTPEERGAIMDSYFQPEWEAYLSSLRETEQIDDEL